MLKDYLDYSAPRYVTANNSSSGDVRFALYEAGPEDGPPLMLCHGWPELAYSWKHIVPPLARAGYRVIAPDMKGFGRTSAPSDDAAFGMDVLTADFAALLEALDLSSAIFIGHDWGGAFVWPMAYRYPDLVRGVASICTPHVRRAPAPPLSIFEKRAGPKHYIIEFQDATKPDNAFGGREEAFCQYIFRDSPPRAAWDKLMPQALYMIENFTTFEQADPTRLVMPLEDLAVFAEMYRKTGFRSCTGYYRNIDHNWQITEGVDITVRQPSLMIGADRDMMLTPEQMDGMEDLCTDLEKHVLPSCGHWAMWEKPEEVHTLLLNWLQKRFPV